MPMQNLATNTAAVAETTPAPDISGTYEVSVEWQPEGCYTATSDDIFGLVLEMDSLEEMQEEMLEAVPMLLEVMHDLAPIAKDRLSVRQVGEANPKGVTKYEFVISA